eukprot:gene2922-3640_t
MVTREKSNKLLSSKSVKKSVVSNTTTTTSNSSNKNDKLLAEEILDSMVSTATKSIDPESHDVFGDGIQIRENLNEDFGSIEDSQGLRLRGELPSTFTTGVYSGKKSSRKVEELEYFDDDDFEVADDDEELEDKFQFENKHSGKDDDEEEDDDDGSFNIIGSTNIDKANNILKKLKQQEEDDENEPMLVKTVSVEDELEKSLNTKNQTVLYDDILGIKIHLQKSVAFANRFPKTKTFKQFIEVDKKVESKFKESKQLATSLLSDLFNLQTNDEISSNNNNSKKRIREDSSLNEIWDIINEQNQRLMTFNNSTINKWNNRINVGGPTTKNLKSINQSILTQITNTLNDYDRLQRRTRLKRSNFTIFGENEKKQEELNKSKTTITKNQIGREKQITTEDDDENESEKTMEDEYDDEIFDDTDFYQILLTELVNRNKGSNSGTDELGSQYWSEMKNLKKKKKKKVNQKASKGRILRYQVFPKLENFMAPVPLPTPTWNVDDIYRNLFSGIGLSNITDD